MTDCRETVTKVMNINRLLNDSSTANDPLWPRPRHFAGIPVHWKYDAFETIIIRRHHIGVVAPMMVVTLTQKIFASQSNTRSAWAN